MADIIGQMLVSEGIINAQQLKTAVDYKNENRIHLGDACVKLGYIDKEQLFDVLGLQMHLPRVNLNYFRVDLDSLRLIESETAIRLNVLPLYFLDNELALATADPLDISSIDKVIRLTGKKLQLVLSTREQIESALQSYYAKLDQDATAQKGKESAEEISEEQSNLIIEIADEILRESVRTGVSDIHLEHTELEVIVRFRIDGVLQVFQTYEKAISRALVSRFKILANIDIAESRKPQDGRFEFSLSKTRKIDLRVSTYPSVFGEKIVMRLLDPAKGDITLDKLGFSAPTLNSWNKACNSSNGIILVTGPTGSGKSTTLFATLNFVSTVEKHIITIEDPIEYKFKYIVQGQVNERAGMTFSNALRAMLRQDPDIIMVGEMRDRETIDLAIRAALTGHLVFSTVHTNDAASTYSRLLDMNTDPFLMSSTIRAILAQRLIRRLCTQCKKAYTPDSVELASIGISTAVQTIYKTGTGGCNQCRHTGYKGRIGLYELLVPSEEINELVKDRKSDIEIRKMAIAQGMATLEQEGMRLVMVGSTSIEEIKRAL